MKKTFLAMMVMGSTVSLLAQNPPTTTTTTTNPTMQTSGNSAAINTWNGVSVNSTSWTPETEASWRWHNHGVWNSNANWNANPNAASVYGSNTMNNNSAMNGSMGNNSSTVDADGTMRSTGSYNAYGTAIPYLPQHIQYRFTQDYPAGANNMYSWNQYGDWYYTHQMNNGRLTQYFYDTRGNGYSLALPVVQTYVPENIINSALNKYGSNLYSIGMVKTNSGNHAYQIGLIDKGQISMHYLDDSGVTVNDVWRSEDMNNTMMSTQSNAAMGEGMDKNKHVTNQSTLGTAPKTKKYNH